MTFRKEIEKIINCHSQENGSHTPDFILANYLANCLMAFDLAVNAREKWYGRPGDGWRGASEPSDDIFDWKVPPPDAVGPFGIAVDPQAPAPSDR